MIEGTIGEAILTKVVDLQLEGLVDGDEVTATLIAAAFADALRKDQTPRSVLDAVWQNLPSDEAWNAGLEEKVREALELREAV